jgi:Ni/Fe-hydrogenase subunit HybB-like protein
VSIDYSKPLPLVEGTTDLREIDDAIADPMENPRHKEFYTALGIALFCLGIGIVSVLKLLLDGVGVWGNNNTVAWGFPIVNFVFWIGIGHAGTLISAILFLMRQNWRTGIARFAEAMTIFAVITALLFPLLHTGRPWLAHYLLPYPNERALWVNFRSPLLWDVFAVSTYFTVSFVFWYIGLVPDFATMRDRTTAKLKKTIYTIFSLGWRFSNRHWQHYERAYLILAGLCTPLVLSVHSIVSMDFAVSIVPGWHTTIFPPYFVAGAIFSGFAMVITVLLVVRRIYHLEHIITMLHLERMSKVLMATGLMVGYAYSMEFFIAWYSGVEFEQYVFINRAFGTYAWGYWIMVTCNTLIPQVFWFKKCRNSLVVLFIVSITTNIGMWFERFVIVVSSLHRDYLPSSWGDFIPTIWDFSLLLGSFGFFFTGVILFSRFMPVTSMSEVKAVSDCAQPTHHGGDHE